LSWQSDKEALGKALSLAHQFLFKPCEAAVLIETLTRALSQSDRVGDGKVKKFVSQLSAVPAPPSLYLELKQELQSQALSLHRAGDIISRDPSVAAKIVQLVNSPQFGLSWKVSNPTEAGIYLGMEILSALVLSLQVFPLFNKSHLAMAGLEGIWAHSWGTAVLAKRICSLMHRNLGMAERAFIAGLLHDLGKAVLAASMPNSYRDVLRFASVERLPLWKAEVKVFACSHAEVAGYLLDLWGLSNPIVEGVAYHHQPADAPNRGLSLVMAVHAANALIREQQADVLRREEGLLDSDYVLNLGLGSHVDTWRDECTSLLRMQEAEQDRTELATARSETRSGRFEVKGGVDSPSPVAGGEWQV
jgi:HD-like signal output (HDOD) protein